MEKYKTIRRLSMEKEYYDAVKKQKHVERLTGCEVRNPRDPRLNDTTGGTAPLNKFDACNITPSPPKHATKSTLSWRSLIFKQMHNTVGHNQAVDR